MKKIRLLTAVLALSMLLAGCSQTSLENYVSTTPQGAVVISALPDEHAADTNSATLYFRYADTSLLKQETRQLSIMPNETRERALVSALIAGSQEGGAPLFPPGVEVLSTQVQSGVVFVTFNEALYGRYEDESGLLTGAEPALRRRLAMEALTATLTESGEHHAVQVLVRAESDVGASMRLRSSYFLEESELPAEPLIRSEDHLMTPANVTHSVLLAWQQRSFDVLYPLLSMQGDAQLLPSQTLFSEAFARSDMLIGYTLTPGSISPDGQSAVVCVHMTLRRSEGGEYTVSGWPLRLTRENGAWKISVSALRALMQLSEE